MAAELLGTNNVHMHVRAPCVMFIAYISWPQNCLDKQRQHARAGTMCNIYCVYIMAAELLGTNNVQMQERGPSVIFIAYISWPQNCLVQTTST